MKFEKLPDGRISCPFDHHSAEYATDYFSVLDETRSAGPLVWSELYGGFWVATGYEVVRKLTMNSAALSTAHGPDRKGGLAIPTRPGTKTRPLFVPGEAAGEAHDTYRRALNPHFSRQRVIELQPMIQRHVSTAIGRMLEAKQVDIIGDFSAPILSGIACEHLGLESDDPPAFFRSLAHMIAYAGNAGGAFGSVADSFDGAWPKVVATVAERRARPREDVISHLTRCEKPAFTDEEIQMMTLNVILGSADTTSSLLGQIIMYLNKTPDLRSRLRSDPELIRPALEEFMRLFAITFGAGRTVTQDVVVGDVTLRTGDRILLSYVGANHDEERYPNPYDFDLERGAGRHLAMGVGMHFCLGSHLAKAIAETALHDFLVRIQDVRIDNDGVETNEDKNGVNQMLRIPAAVA